jgi:hypothetical protein
MTNALKSIVKYEFTDLDGKISNFFFCKAHQYATTNDRVCRNFRFVFIKYAQLNKVNF